MKKLENLAKPVIGFAAMLLVGLMAACSSGGGSGDGIAPTVSTTSPANVATAVVLNTKVTATFSEAMDASTINTTTFTLKQGTTSVTGAVTYVGKTAVFTPAASLTASLVYTATISTAVKDVAGNEMAASKVWTFTTGTAADSVLPTVISTIPADVSVDRAINANVTATFSEAMDVTTIDTTTFTLKQGTTPVAGTVTVVGNTAFFKPSSNLANNTLYSAAVSTGVKDMAGNALLDTKTWSFTTGSTTDIVAPTVNSTVPASAATGVAINSASTATFSEVMDAATINTATFTLKQGTTPVTGDVTYLGTTAMFTPASQLASGTVYTATITTGAKDLAGNALATDKVWSFTTGTAVAMGPARVLLGTSGNYVILAKTGVSTVPASVITGDVGVSPAATSFLTGFSLTMVGTTAATSTQVTGFLYGADMTAPTSTSLTTAVDDMATAYTDAAGRPTPDFLNLGTGEIGGQTLVPGLYKWTTGVTISTNVTITGAADDVWIFQIPGTLLVSASKRVILGGAAKAKNIFWQVADTVTIEAGAHFEGIILSQTSIAMRTNATMNGRALAQTAVTLDQSTVTKPAD